MFEIISGIIYNKKYREGIVMLEQNDLEVLRKIMKEEIAESEKRIETVIDSRIAESEKKIETVIDSRIAESEKKMETVIDSRVAESENIILKELDRVQMNLERRIGVVQKNLDELNQYYRITKLENDNTALLLKMIDELSKRVEELERKTA